MIGEYTLPHDSENEAPASGMELAVLKISTALTVVYGVIGVSIAVVCDSMTMMLDGLYGVADVVVSLFAIAVVRKIHMPPNERYHFGYAKYEPFMTALDGILIVTICAATIFSSFQDIMHPDPMHNVHLAVIYSFISFFICTGFGLYMKQVGKRCRSTILPADAQLWIIEGVISLGVFVAFGMSEYISRTHWKPYADYVDPVLCIILGIVLLAKPISLIRDSFYDLVDATPYKGIKDEVMNIARACAGEYKLHGVKSVKVRKAGRKLFMIIHFLADKSTALDRTESAKKNMIERVVNGYPDVDVTVLFSGR